MLKQFFRTVKRALGIPDKERVIHEKKVTKLFERPTTLPEPEQVNEPAGDWTLTRTRKYRAQRAVRNRIACASRRVNRPK